MNKRKICISICATTADELFEKIARAEPLADVIELRFDCLSPAEIDGSFDNLPQISGKYLITYRPSEQGGKRVLPLGERIKFWSRVTIKMEGRDYFADHERDIDFPLNFSNERAIISEHYFSGLPYDFAISYEAMASLSGKTAKIAATCSEVTDAIPLWELLRHAQADGNDIIPIAMGEAGKWTRILGLAHGAFMTYASLDADGATAPGQIAAEDMIDVFRVKELDQNTEVFGIIAGDTTYSMSPYIHNPAFKEAGMNRVFVPLQVADLGQFIRRMVKAETREVDLNFHGFSVTNPHKQAIIPFLDELDETARAIGAVNTVKIDGGKLYGYNTDAPGFIRPLLDAYGDITDARAAVFGAGGAARACIYALKQASANVTIFARNEQIGNQLAEEFDVRYKKLETQDSLPETDVLINATPLGTVGATENDTITAAEQLADLKLVYDLIYNPEETRLIREAKTAGCKTLGGLDMLIGQAIRQFEIWTGETPSRETMEAAARKRLSR
jgi:3-dehydroquinate dehydratase/shikimate dehydrogenase